MLDIWQSSQTNQTSCFISAVWKTATRTKEHTISFPKLFKGSILPQLPTADTKIAELILFFFSIYVPFVSASLFIWTKTVRWDLFATIRAEREKIHFPVSKMSTIWPDCSFATLWTFPLLASAADLSIRSAGCAEELKFVLCGAFSPSPSLCFQDVFYCKLPTVCYLGGEAKSWREATKPAVSMVT